jgi:hypothetical protein
MSKSAAFGVLVVVAIAIGLALWWWPAPDTELLPQGGENSELHTYTNEMYGYSIVYPDEVEVEEYTPEVISIGTRTLAGGFDSDVDVSVARSGGEGGYEDFEAFAFERSRNFCAADGPSETIHCERIESRSLFTSTTGVLGEELYLTLVHENFSTGASSTTRFGPIYAFDMSDRVEGSAFTALFIYEPLPSFIDSPDSVSVRDIAESLSLGASN